MIKNNKQIQGVSKTLCQAGLIAALIAGIPMNTALALEEPPQVHFVVERFKVTGNNPLSDEETASVLQKFVGDHYGLEGLQAAAQELEAVFRSKGYAFYRVNLVPQELKDGVIRFEVTEFDIDRVVIDGNQYFSDANIRRSAPGLESGKTPNTTVLSRAINMANEQPSKSLKLTFAESQSGGAIDAKIKVADQSPNFFFFNLNNTGTSSTGEYRLTSAYTWSNLFDRDHNLTLTYTLSPDELDVVSQFGAFYSLPNYRDGSKWNFFLADSDVQTGIINNNFEISGSGTVIGASYNKRLLQTGTYKQEYEISLTQKAFENSTALSSTPSKVTSRPLGLIYRGSWLTTKYNFGFHIDGYFNLSGGSNNDDAAYFAANCSGITTPACEGKADWSLFKYGLNYQYFHSGWVYRIALEGQQTGDQLISGEQFGVGGSRSVRGFEERTILGDSGYQINLEAWMPALTRYQIRPLFFYDMASITREYDQSGLLPDSEDLASIGAGMRWSHNTELSVSADLGYVLQEAGNVEKGDVRLHIDVFYRL